MLCYPRVSNNSETAFLQFGHDVSRIGIIIISAANSRISHESDAFEGRLASRLWAPDLAHNKKSVLFLWMCGKTHPQQSEILKKIFRRYPDHEGQTSVNILWLSV